MRDLNQIYGTGLPRVETTISDKAIQECVTQCADLMALRALNAYLNAECDALKSDLATNAALLAKQHDRNMELETALLIKEKQLRTMAEAVICSCTRMSICDDTSNHVCIHCGTIRHYFIDKKGHTKDCIVTVAKQILNSKGE